jgi:glycosyltransferase involved in cell wall biosynthesis
MDSLQPKVSVGIPVYNGEPFLAEALESILNQSFRDYEVIISDNASTDATKDICLHYMAKDRRIRYVRNARNMGAAWNFNQVFLLSRGTYFKWLAADDVCAPTFLEACIDILATHSQAVLAYPRAYGIDKQGCVVHDYAQWMSYGSPWPADPVERFRRVLTEFSRNGGSSAPVYIFGLIRSEALRRTRLIGSYIGSDCNLIAELALLGPFVEVEDYLHFIRIHEGSSSFPANSSPWRLQHFFDPSKQDAFSIFLSRWRRYIEYYFIINRANLPFHQKLKLWIYNTIPRLERGTVRICKQLVSIIRSCR